MFVALAAVFFTMLTMTLLLTAVAVWCLSLGKPWPFGSMANSGLVLLYASYLAFVMFGTGPTDVHDYPVADNSQYAAPWPTDARSCVAQGHRSVVSHRGTHLHAWDFLRPMHSPILAARGGRVVAQLDSGHGVGWFEGNHITVDHGDGSSALYAHLAQGTARVQIGEQVLQGDHIADVGMVGKTLFPHLHFVVHDADGASLPIQFSDIGLPVAGGCYLPSSEPWHHVAWVGPLLTIEHC